ncbi:MAG: sigma-70 family RNA polymerase sigma factor [Thermoleophilaceae bacterium]|nr:sigma-70 family RNA polymerase sigma factor [Thermoleophilaceae bacterium]
MEASVLRETAPSTSAALLQDPRARFLRLQSDERLVSLTRRGNEAAFETLIDRYRSRLLAFCRHMVGSTEDAEDILQEVFVSAYRAMLADDRDLNVRPWLYRIARNRSLNHLRRPRPTGVDSMDVFEGGAAVATADRVHDKLDLEDLVDDVKRLPETQRTALMLREMGDLSYDQIAEAMDTSIPSVKSLLVRARVSLAEAAESRRLSCDEVRLELGAVAEGLQKLTAPARRHVSDCERCRSFKKDLSTTNRKLTMLAPVGAFAAFKAIVGLKLFSGATAAGSSAAGGSAGAVAGATTAAAGAGAATAGSSAAIAGIGAVAAKVGTGLVAAAIVTGGVAQVARHDISTSKADSTAPIAKSAPAVVDRAATGGATPEVAAVAAAPAKTDPTAETGPAEPVVTLPAETPTSEASIEPSKPVVEKDSTTVSLGDQQGIEAPSGTSESPGLPTGEESSAPTTVAPPAPAPAPSGQTGISSPADTAAGDVTGGAADVGDAVGPTA